MHISAENAKLLPKVFPGLVELHLRKCTIHVAALLTALRSCGQLTHLTMNPFEQSGPISLWAAAEAEAQAAGHQYQLPAAAPYRDDRLRAAAATGYLLSGLPHLTSLKLSVAHTAAALQLLVLRGMGARLQAVSLSGSPEREMGEVLARALSACTSLSSLELWGEIEGLEAVVATCAGLPMPLRTLSIPLTSVDLRELDAILKGLPGERGQA